MTIVVAALPIGYQILKDRAPSAPPISVPAFSSATSTEPGSTRPGLVLGYGTWTLGPATDSEGKDWADSTLKITSELPTPDGLDVVGLFEWRVDSELVGTETVTGHYVDSTRQLFLEGAEVSQASSSSDLVLAVGTYSAVLSKDGRRLVDGVMGSSLGRDPVVPGEWEAWR